MTLTPEHLLSQARRGIESIDLPIAVKRSALANFEDWLRTDKFAGLVAKSDYTALLGWMVEAKKFDLLIDSFYQMIPFGTGGRRGPVGVGPNRINPYTIASSVQGHVKYLRERFPDSGTLKIVIANDVRAFHNIRWNLSRRCRESIDRPEFQGLREYRRSRVLRGWRRSLRPAP